MVGRGGRYVLHRRRDYADIYRDGIGRLLPRVLGLWWRRVQLTHEWRAVGGKRNSGRAMERVPLASGFTNSVYEVVESDDRARACQSSIRHLFFRGLLVSGGAACRISSPAGCE